MSVVYYKHGEQVIHYCRQCGGKTQWRSGFGSSRITCEHCGNGLDRGTCIAGLDHDYYSRQDRTATSHNRDYDDSSSSGGDSSGAFTLLIFGVIVWALYHGAVWIYEGVTTFDYAAAATNPETYITIAWMVGIFAVLFGIWYVLCAIWDWFVSLFK